PEYVANITRVYRKALNDLSPSSITDHASRITDHASGINSHVPSDTRYSLEMAFSRGLYTGWLHGINNQELVHARFGKKRGVYLGDVTRVQGEKVFVRLEGPLKPGDGIVFDAGHPDQKEEGGRVYEIRNASLPGPNAREAILSFGRGDINFSRVQSGDKVWKTDDPD